MEPKIKKTALYIFGILASAMTCFIVLYVAVLFSSVNGHWTRATFPWTDRAAYASLALSLAFFIAFVYFTLKISTPNADMTSWQKNRYRCSVFAVTIGFLFIALGLSLLICIFAYNTTDAEAGFLVAFPLLIGFISLSFAAALAFSVRHQLSKKAYRWLTFPAIMTFILWLALAMITAITSLIHDANRFKS